MLRESHQKINTSRLIALTGIHRHEVDKLVFSPPEETAEARLDLLTRVIHQWEHDPRFCNKNGSPRTLLITAESDEFKALVHSVGKYLHHGTVLFALQKLGKVIRTPKGVGLTKERSVISSDYLAGAQILGTDIHHLISAVDYNLTAPKAAFHHRRTGFNGIPHSHIGELRNWIRDEGAKFHEKIRRKLGRFDSGADSESRKDVGTLAITSFCYSDTLPEKGET